MQPATTDAAGCADNLAAMADAALLVAARSHLRKEGLVPGYAELLLAEVCRRWMEQEEDGIATSNN